MVSKKHTERALNVIGSMRVVLPIDKVLKVTFYINQTMKRVSETSNIMEMFN